VATLGPCPRVVVENATREWQLLESNPADKYFGMNQIGTDSCTQMDDVRGQVRGGGGGEGGLVSPLFTAYRRPMSDELEARTRAVIRV
jgi:hypothetical protein